MTFLSPVWLLALLPWAALAVGLLWGRRERVGVPFLELWRGPVKGPRAKRAVQVPPVALALVIVALLCAVIAMAQPIAAWWMGHSGPEVVIIVDRGLTMPPGRLKDAASAAQSTIARTLGDGPTQYVVVPEAKIDATNRGAIADVVAKVEPTAVDTSESLRLAIANAIQSTRENQSPILVFSDRPLAFDSPRVVQIVPPTLLNDVAISRLGVRASPRPQVMVQITNRSPHRGANLKIESGGKSVKKEIELPATGLWRNEFIDLPALGDTATATLDMNDDIALDNVAYLARSSSWPRIEPRFPLPPELRRMVDVYREARPPTDGSRTVALIDELKSTSTTMPSARSNDATILIPSAGETKLPAERLADLQITSHAITADVDWSEALRGATLAASPAPTGWPVLVRAAGRPILAIAPETDDASPRAAWVGFRSTQFPRASDYPVFWAHLFEWAGPGGEAYSPDAAEWLPGEWTRIDATNPSTAALPGARLTPGLYRRSDGTVGAVSPAPLPENLVNRSDWSTRLASLQSGQGTGRSASPALLLLALGMMLASALFWRSKPQLDRIFGAT